MTDAMAQRTDLAADMQNAIDQFRRLARMEPGTLAAAPDLRAQMPADAQTAIGLASGRHPRLLSLEQQNQAVAHEFEAQRAQSRPRISADVDANVRNYIGPGPRTELDVRSMLTLRYKLFDGGLNRSLEDQIRARARQGEARFRDARDEIEADIRQSYRSLEAARAKFANLQQTLQSSRQVITLYTEQFQGGKRTLFELLDAQTALSTARRQVIINQFEERRAIYGILRSVGRLTPTILAARR
jgi:adhesin transport system outer membrane protein